MELDDIQDSPESEQTERGNEFSSLGLQVPRDKMIPLTTVLSIDREIILSRGASTGTDVTPCPW